jgi:hypothetical protein
MLMLNQTQTQTQTKPKPKPKPELKNFDPLKYINMTMIATLILDTTPVISWDADGNLSITSQSSTPVITMMLTIPIDLTYHRTRTSQDIQHSLTALTHVILQLQGVNEASETSIEISRLVLRPTDMTTYYLYVNPETQMVLQCHLNKETIHLKFPPSSNLRFAEWLQYIKSHLEKLIPASPARSASRCYVS